MWPEWCMLIGIVCKIESGSKKSMCTDTLTTNFYTDRLMDIWHMHCHSNYNNNIMQVIFLATIIDVWGWMEVEV